MDFLPTMPQSHKTDNFVPDYKQFFGYATITLVLASVNLALKVVEMELNNESRSQKDRSTYIRRKRRKLEDLRYEYGSFFRRAYRMSYESFQKLYCLIKDGIEEHIKRGQSRNESPFAPNGCVTADIRLAIALRWFAGGSYLDIKISHSVGKDEVYRSIWAVVSAVNKCDELKIAFPTNTEGLKDIANEFSKRSKAGFTNCVGCIDGLLVWIDKPRKTSCVRAGVDSGKFYCGRKGKYGLNLQGVCDARRRFLDVSISHPASASDYLAFITSSLYQKLTSVDTALPPGYCLYGDNAYVNDSFMAVPFPNTASGPKDSYNYYHSQVRINIECAFGVLTNRWRILKAPINSTISVNRVMGLVYCLCQLHNFCIDEGDSNAPSRYEHDVMTLMDFAVSPDVDDLGTDARPIGLLGGSEHFEDIQGGRRGLTTRVNRANTHNELPRTAMLRHVINRDIHRTRPFDQGGEK